MQVFTFRISVSITITANKRSPLLFRLALLLNVLQKPSWPLQGGGAVLVGEHQGDGSETKQSAVIHGDIFHVSGKSKYTRCECEAIWSSSEEPDRRRVGHSVWRQDGLRSSSDPTGNKLYLTPSAQGRKNETKTGRVKESSSE